MPHRSRRDSHIGGSVTVKKKSNKQTNTV